MDGLEWDNPLRIRSWKELINWVSFPGNDEREIAESEKMFFGYSDLTTILNAVYTKTGKPSVLYQVLNLVGSEAEIQK